MKPLSVSKISKEDAFVKALVSDLAGQFKEIIFPARTLPELIKSGIAYDGSSFKGVNAINASDAILRGVPETLVKVPAGISDTDKVEYWIICDILKTDGEPHPHCARSVLMGLQDQLAKLWDGGRMYMGAEPEAYFVDMEVEKALGEGGGGNANYFNPKDPKSFIISEIAIALESMGYVLERAHTEVGEDQFEVNWEYDLAERTADRIQMFKLIAHKISRVYGYEVTFLPKPYPSRNGSGMHCHLSVADGKKNLFFDPKNTKQDHFSAKSLQFLTGILNNSRALAAIANPTEVSYARLVPGFEAPCIVAIGSCNRSAACRIPAIPEVSQKKYAQRAEFRYPDPMANPYLLAAGFVAAGMLGIEKKAKFPGFVVEDLFACSLAEIRKKGYTLLPRNLWEAYGEFVDSKLLAKKLGESLHAAYSDLVLEEVDTCQSFANRESVRLHYYD
jgi:glutamine synthetase